MNRFFLNFPVILTYFREKVLSGYWQSLPELADLAQEVSGKRILYFVVPNWTPYMAVPFLSAVSFFTKKEPLITWESLHAVRGSRIISHKKAELDLGYQPTPMLNTVAAIYKSFIANGYLVESSKGLIPNWKQQTLP